MTLGDLAANGITLDASGKGATASPEPIASAPAAKL
jgi:hypothetical protein